VVAVAARDTRREQLIYPSASLILRAFLRATRITIDRLSPRVAITLAAAQPPRGQGMNPLKSITGTIVTGVVLAIIIALIL
jgi:hypothetical protein